MATLPEAQAALNAARSNLANAEKAAEQAWRETKRTELRTARETGRRLTGEIENKRVELAKVEEQCETIGQRLREMDEEIRALARGEGLAEFASEEEIAAHEEKHAQLVSKRLDLLNGPKNTSLNFERHRLKSELLDLQTQLTNVRRVVGQLEVIARGGRVGQF